MRWTWLRCREGARWLFRGSDFRKLETEIDRMAAPLFSGVSAKSAAKLRRRINHAVSYLPADRAEKFHDMMARAGHPLRSTEH